MSIGGHELGEVAAAQPRANVAASVAPRLRLLGWQIHASQHLDRAYPLPGWLLFDFWDKEHYVVFEPSSIGSNEITERPNKALHPTAGGIATGRG